MQFSVTQIPVTPTQEKAIRNTELNQNSQPKQRRAKFGQEEKANEERNSQTGSGVSKESKERKHSAQFTGLLITCTKQHPCLLSPSHGKELSLPAGWNTSGNGRETCIQKSEVVTYMRCLLLVM